MTPLSEGWGVLKEKNGKAEVDFLSSITGVHYKDALKNIANTTIDGQPLYFAYYWDEYENSSTMSIITDQGGAFFDAYAMKKEADILDRFNSMASFNTE